MRTHTNTAGPFVMGMAMRQARAEIPVAAVDDPPAVEPEAGGGYLVRGVARVLAGPHRRDGAARRLAARIALRPTTYLPLALGLNLPGVTDLRPSFGRTVAHV